MSWTSARLGGSSSTARMYHLERFGLRVGMRLFLNSGRDSVARWQLPAVFLLVLHQKDVFDHLRVFLLGNGKITQVAPDAKVVLFDVFFQPRLDKALPDAYRFIRVAIHDLIDPERSRWQALDPSSVELHLDPGWKLQQESQFVGFVAGFLVHVEENRVDVAFSERD